jgi:hypothetical protein
MKNPKNDAKRRWNEWRKNIKKKKIHLSVMHRANDGNNAKNVVVGRNDLQRSEG